MRRRHARVWRPTAVKVIGGIAVMGAIAAGNSFTGPAENLVTITINGARPGLVFQGVGAISGGGGNSRLLIDYPHKQLQEVLDYLFKPGYGASIQLLKVEIGGDAFATDGAEPSIEHSPGQINCAADYEFWLAKQALALNPHIQLIGLQWNAPHWAGGATGDPWSAADIGYVIDWLRCAAKDRVPFNYVGGWNEHLPGGITAHAMRWFIRLRAALDQNGFRQVKIIAADSLAHGQHDVSSLLAGHPRFRAALSVLGYHNLCRYPATGNDCWAPRAALVSGLPIWNSEIGALRPTTGIGAMTRSIINAYLESRAAGLMEWPLMGSMPAYLAEEDRGLVFAEQPWSGHFQVNQMTWVIAQTTEFTQPGWLHVLGAGGQFDGNSSSYAAYESPSHSAWTLVVQTSQAPTSQDIEVRVDAGLPHTRVHVWSTNIKSANPTTWFDHHVDVQLTGGVFRYHLLPGYIYTFTTVAGGGAGAAATGSPTAKPMPLPYRAVPDASNEPLYLGAQDGAFAYVSPTTFEQTAVGAPVFWQNPVSARFPYAVLGDNGWRDYTVAAAIRFTAAGQSAGLIARYVHEDAKVAEYFDGYQFVVSSTGAWRLLRDSPVQSPTTLASGQIAAPGTGTWTSLRFAVRGSRLTGAINGTTVVTATDATYLVGDAGISTGGWYQVQFQDLTVSQARR